MSTEQTDPPDCPSRNRWAVAGLTLGIAIWTVGWALLWVPPAQLAIVVAGIIASAVGLSRAGQVDEEGRAVCGGRGFSIAGLVMSCVAAPGILIWMALWIASFSNGGS